MAWCFLRTFPPSYPSPPLGGEVRRGGYRQCAQPPLPLAGDMRGGRAQSFLRIVVSVQEALIGIEAEARAGRHVERGFPAGVAEAVRIHRIVGLDGGEVALALRDRQHVQR